MVIESKSRFIGDEYQAIFDASPDATFILALSGQILDANHTAEQKYGYSLQAFKQLHFSALAGPNKDSATSNLFDKPLGFRKIIESEHQYKDTSKLPVEIYLKPITLQGQSIILARVRDISLRHNLELELQSKKHLLNKVLDAEPGTVYIFDLITENNVYVNQHILSVFGYLNEDGSLLGPDLDDSIHPDDLIEISKSRSEWKDANDDEVRSREYRIRGLETNWHWLTCRETPFARDETGKVSKIIGIVYDASARKTAELAVINQSKVLEKLAAGKSLHDVLTTLVLLIEEQVFGMMGSIILLNNDGIHIRHGAAPNLPAEFVAAIDGLAIGNCTGSCGTAIYRKKAVYVEDIATDPLWQDYKEIALQFGLRSCWSMPIFDADGNALGSFAMYYKQVDLPSIEHIKIINSAANLAAIAIGRANIINALYENEERLRLFLRYSPTAIAMFDCEMRYLAFSQRWLTDYDLQEQDLLGSSHYDIFPKMPENWKEAHRLSLKGEVVKCDEDKVIRSDGSEYWLKWETHPWFTSEGEIGGIIIFTELITDRKSAEQRIYHLANFDALTNLPNRTQLTEHLKYAINLTKRENGHLAALFIDIDHFKDINDTLGHSIGDALLVKVAERFKLALREIDRVSRFGGDEFFLILPDCDALGAAQVAQKLLEVIAQPCKIGVHELVISVSIGIAIYPDDGTDVESLSRSADTAMYLAKNDGRNDYRFFTADMQMHAARNLQLVHGLRNALELGQLEVYYQPQISIKTQKMVGVEALLRWQHPEFGLISPTEFIPVAEASGLILPIGEWVMRTAVKQLKQWIEVGYLPFVVAVNLSAIQFRDKKLTKMVKNILSETGLPAEYLELELTEGIAMSNPLEVIKVINELDAEGINISIDDFGTGYSSLSYLKQFKVYKLKIDQSFVHDINTDMEDRAIVLAIINMADSLGLKTIAEGVETIDQLTFLQEQGCDEVQGYFYCKPLPAKEVEQFFNDFKP
jgi:diguanylate cyclase (GGDEF)-like protein/PAS domain S-box-containing protein